MAYKYQLGAATLSGSLTQEGSISIKDDSGTLKASVDNTGVISGSSHLESGGNLQIAGTVKLNGVADAAIAVSADSLYFKDADGSMKSDTVADLMTAAAGDGLVASSGVLAINVADMASAMTGDVADTDEFAISDGGTMKKVDFSVVRDAAFADVSGDATIAAGGALTIAADAVEPSMMNIFDDSLAATDTHFMIGDGTDYSSFALSGDVTCTNAGVVTIANDAVETAMLNDNVISGQSELAQGSLAAADEFLLSDGGTLKRYGVDSFAKDALALTTEAAIADGDYITFLDGGATGETKKESLADLATLFAGDGLSAASSVLSVAVSGAVKLDSDKIGISGSFAGAGLAYLGGVDSIEAIELDLNELVAASVDVGNDSIAIIDANDSNVSKKESIADLMTAAAGAGLAAASGVLSVDIDELGAGTTLHQTEDHFMFSDDGTEKKITFSDLQDSVFADVSGDATIAAGGALTIAANAVEDSMVNDNVATGLAGVGLSAASGVMALDLNELSAAAVDVANDSIALIDANDSNGSKKESIVDLVAAMAGAGLSAASGQLSVTGNNVALKADGDTLVEGYNYFANASSNATVSLPAAPSVGDVVTIKAGNLTSGATVIVNRQGSHTIDGLTQIIIESPFGSVTLVYVVANDWRIV